MKIWTVKLSGGSNDSSIEGVFFGRADAIASAQAAADLVWAEREQDFRRIARELRHPDPQPPAPRLVVPEDPDGDAEVWVGNWILEVQAHTVLGTPEREQTKEEPS
jgi:hypothetical protein